MTGLPYRVVVEPLAPADGGGYLATVPDLPGCTSDGDTPAQALSNVEDAAATWLAEARRLDRPIPAPTYAAA